MHSRVDGLEDHLTERINILGRVDAEYVSAQLALMTEDIEKFANRPVVMTPPLAIDT